MDVRRSGLQLVIVRKRITYTGGAGAGAVGSVAIFTISAGGAALITITARCATSLTGATATIALGVTGNTSLLIAATTATGITTSAPHWTSITPATGGIAVPAAMKDIQIDASILNTIAVAGVSGGVIDYTLMYVPLIAGTVFT